MFSSTNTTFNPFPQQYYFSSSSLPSLPPILNQETATTASASAAAAASDDILFHHDPLCASPFLLNISPLIPETSSVINLGVSNSAGTMTKQDMCNLYGDHHHHDHHQHHHHHNHDGVPKFLSKKPIKKDRHSKIYTAQGLRDRRVRLSIEIAREFFDLQDMLGFDKASKTLEWLMGKSKKAIKDLARTKLSSGKSSSLTSECEEDEQEQVNEVAGDHENQQEQEQEQEQEEEEEEEEEKGLVVISKSKKVLKERKLNEAAAALRHLRTAKESRAKARARARERTREKMCTSTPTIFNIHDPRKCPPPCPSSSSSSSQILNQLRTTMNHHQSPKIFAEINQAIHESSSVMIKRKLMKPSSISSFQHHHHQQHQQQQLNVISSSSKGGQTSNDNMFCPNLPQNWDINSPLIATTRPSFCAITNMNLSTELQIYGKTMGGQ